MTVKLAGALLIFLGCAGYGFYLAEGHLRESKTLQQLSECIQFMQRDLRYRLTPLPDLCRKTALEAKGILRIIFNDLAEELDRQVSPSPKTCMYAVLSRYPKIPPISASCLQELGTSLGRFDLFGQLEALEAEEKSCKANLETIINGQDVRLRTCRTLGICCGAALVILFI